MPPSRDRPRKRPRPSIDELRKQKARWHPLRLEILSVLHDRSVASPREVSEALVNYEFNTVAYHMKKLFEAGLIELAETRQRRNTVEHRYRPLDRPIFSDDDFASLTVALRKALFEGVILRCFHDVNEASIAGGFTDPDAHVSRAHLKLDEEGWSKVKDILATAVREVLDVQQESTERMAEVAEDERHLIDSSMIVMLFRSGHLT